MRQEERQDIKYKIYKQSRRSNVKIKSFVNNVVVIFQLIEIDGKCIKFPNMVYYDMNLIL